MATDMHRKIELQAPADFTYLHANTVALSRQKLDLHLPPSANPDDGPDPMRERVRELVDDVCLPANRQTKHSFEYRILTRRQTVHPPHLHLRLLLHQHQRPRLLFPPIPLPSGADRPRRNGRVRSLRRPTRLAVVLAIRTIRVLDHDRRTVATGCAPTGGGGVFQGIAEVA